MTWTDFKERYNHVLVIQQQSAEVPELTFGLLTFVLFLDVRWDKVMEKQDDLCIHGNLDVVVKLSHEAGLHHRLGVCGQLMKQRVHCQIMAIAFISVAPYITDVGEDTALYKINNNIYINPLTAPACKISGLKDAWTHLRTVYLPFLRHLSSVLCVSMKILLSAKKKTEAIKGFKFYTFIGCFQVTSWQWWG